MIDPVGDTRGTSLDTDRIVLIYSDGTITIVYQTIAERRLTWQNEERAEVELKEKIDIMIGRKLLMRLDDYLAEQEGVTRSSFIRLAVAKVLDNVEGLSAADGVGIDQTTKRCSWATWTGRDGMTGYLETW